MGLNRKDINMIEEVSTVPYSIKYYFFIRKMQIQKFGKKKIKKLLTKSKKNNIINSTNK